MANYKIITVALISCNDSVAVCSLFVAATISSHVFILVWFVCCLLLPSFRVVILLL